MTPADRRAAPSPTARDARPAELVTTPGAASTTTRPAQSSRRRVRPVRCAGPPRPTPAPYSHLLSAPRTVRKTINSAASPHRLLPVLRLPKFLQEPGVDRRAQSPAPRLPTRAPGTPAPPRATRRRRLNDYDPEYSPWQARATLGDSNPTVRNRCPKTMRDTNVHFLAP
jgi:hypothetical protein